MLLINSLHSFTSVINQRLSKSKQNMHYNFDFFLIKDKTKEKKNLWNYRKGKENTILSMS